MSWDPFRDIRKMRKRMENLFNDLENRSYSKLSRGQGPKGEQKAPFTDVQERDEEIVVTADLPGVTKDDINVEIKDNSLVISAERGSESSEEGEDFIRRERRFGRFYRKIKLPKDVEKEETEATFQNGVLEIKLPKKEEKEEEGKQIEIK